MTAQSEYERGFREGIERADPIIGRLGGGLYRFAKAHREGDTRERFITLEIARERGLTLGDLENAADAMAALDKYRSLSPEPAGDPFAGKPDDPREFAGLPDHLQPNTVPGASRTPPMRADGLPHGVEGSTGPERAEGMLAPPGTNPPREPEEAVALLREATAWLPSYWNEDLGSRVSAFLARHGRGVGATPPGEGAEGGHLR